MYHGYGHGYGLGYEAYYNNGYPFGTPVSNLFAQHNAGYPYQGPPAVVAHSAQPPTSILWSPDSGLNHNFLSAHSGQTFMSPQQTQRQDSASISSSWSSRSSCVELPIATVVTRGQGTSESTSFDNQLQNRNYNPYYATNAGYHYEYHNPGYGQRTGYRTHNYHQDVYGISNAPVYRYPDAKYGRYENLSGNNDQRTNDSDTDTYFEPPPPGVTSGNFYSAADLKDEPNVSRSKNNPHPRSRANDKALQCDSNKKEKSSGQGSSSSCPSVQGNSNRERPTRKADPVPVRSVAKTIKRKTGSLEKLSTSTKLWLKEQARNTRSLDTYRKVAVMLQPTSTLNTPSKLYHYTSEEGAFGIMKDTYFRPKEMDWLDTSARYGSGIYFTDIHPKSETELILLNNYNRVLSSDEPFTEFCFEFQSTDLPELFLCNSWTKEIRPDQPKRKIWMAKVNKLDFNQLSTIKYYYRQLNSIEAPDNVEEIILF